jgi:hypothetical protein
MNNMRQISPPRGAFFIYYTVSAYLKSEFELLYAGKSVRSGSSERLHCCIAALKLDEYHSLYNAHRLFFTPSRTPACPASPALHKVADPL